MDIAVIPIGNSKGIRLTKTLIEKYNIKDTVELILEKDYIIIKPKNIPRLGWEKSFKQMNENSKLFLSGYSYFGDNFEVVFNDKIPKQINQVNQKWLLYGKGDSITVIKNGDTTKLEARGSFNRLLISETTSSWSKLKIKSGKTPIYGISCEPKCGVILDNFSFRGISGENLNKI